MEAHMQTIAAGVQTLLERHQDAAPNLNPSMDTSPRRMRRLAEVADQPSLESDGPAGCLFYRSPSTIAGTSSRSATGASTIPSTAAAGGERAEASAAPRESEPARPERVQAGAGARLEQAEAQPEEAQPEEVLAEEALAEEAQPEEVLAEEVLAEGAVGGRVDLPLLLGRAEVAARELRAAREQAERQVRSRWAEKGRRQLLTEDLRWAEMARAERKAAARRAAVERAAAERSAVARADAERAAAEEKATRDAEARKKAAEAARHEAHQHVLTLTLTLALTITLPLTLTRRTSACSAA